MITAKRRPRRIAADEAHAWARNLRLGNLQAKMVLSMLSLYVDGDGVCFVSIPTLAEDCELSPDTVRRRLAWLEEIGALRRSAQWIDEYGNPNPNGRGKRTSDKIRLLYDADQDLIEARARGELETPAVSTAISPSCQPGLKSEIDAADPGHQQGLQDSVGTRLGLGQPSHCGQGLISEPEPESPPLPPSGGRDAAALDEVEPEHFQLAWSSYPGHEAMRRDLGLAEFRLLTPDKQKLCRAAIPDYASKIAKLGWKPRAFHLWVRAAGFDEFPNARLPEERPPPPTRRLIRGDELAGFTVAVRIAERRDPVLVSDRDLGKGVWRTAPLQPDLLALAGFATDDRELWPVVEEGSGQFAAWRDRLKLWLGVEPEAERIWLEPHDPDVHGLSPMHPKFKVRKSMSGFRVPRPWPPRRDGSWSEAGGSA